MSESPAEFVERQAREAEAFRKALSGESDRGCALFAAAYLDSCLSDLLYVTLVANKKIDTDLFEGTAPLSTFSSRIKMAYYLGLISQPCRRDIDIIRGIRNDFAHKLDIDSFTLPSVGDRCRALAYSYHEKDQVPKAHFVSASDEATWPYPIGRLGRSPTPGEGERRAGCGRQGCVPGGSSGDG